MVQAASGTGLAIICTIIYHMSKTCTSISDPLPVLSGVQHSRAIAVPDLGKWHFSNDTILTLFADDGKLSNSLVTAARPRPTVHLDH